MFAIGFSIIWTAGRQFRVGYLSWVRLAGAALLNLVVTVPSMLLGYDGLAYIADNLVIALLLFAAGREYWLSRQEAPTPLYGLTVLYSLTASSFVLCAIMLIWKGQLVIGVAPDNWTEDLNIGISIASMTGIGALSLALHQWRQANRHRTDAMTDQLTGLMNRRALFDLYGKRSFTPLMAVILFDIDRFKAVNDDHGHAAGDGMLKVFADELMANLRGSDVVARHGGEEFALVLENVMPGRAEQIAERVRESFAERELHIDGKILKCTVSAGIAFGAVGGVNFGDVLNAADKALYTAKRNGRNRIESADYLRNILPAPSLSA
jgi:diguanylate cyclase (GGDEF)-like protein